MDKYLVRESKKYQTPVPSREYILSTIKKNKALKKSQLSEILTLEEHQKKAFSYRIKAMLRDQQLSVDHAGKLVLFTQKNGSVGKVIGNVRGFGFVELEGKENDLRLSSKQMQTVFHGETVVARRFFDKKEAQIISVEKRIDTLVGRVICKNDVYYLQADDKRITQKILIQNDDKKTISVDEMVVGEIVRYPTYRELTLVKIKTVLGHYFDDGVEVQSALLRYEIPQKFNQSTLKEVKELPKEVIEKDKLNRTNLTHLPLITIDGEDSRDFDDAICVKKENKGWRLWVCIADVSYYVHQGSALDQEARKRTTSVYFPNQVVPMLPEEISNGLCSLNPKVDRLCLCCELVVSQSGEVQKTQFYPAIMHSVARMTYTKVSKILEEKNQKLIEEHRHIYPMLLEFESLYHQLISKRKIRGAMLISRSENQMLFNDNGRIEKIVAKKSNKAHGIVEECMLLANCACAEFLQKNKTPFLYRIHDKPKAEKVAKLKEFLTALGLNFPNQDEVLPQDFLNLVEEVTQRDDAQLIQLMILRSMQQASYSSHNIGHFGLAFTNYTHFTSPIRRYPDLVAHRAIKYVLSGHKQTPALLEPKKTIEILAKHCSEKERNAELASRDVEQWLKCEFMSHRIGEVYQGMISSVGNFGLFVELIDLLIDGLVPINSLGDDYFIFDNEQQSLIGKSSKKSYMLGDTIEIRISEVDISERKITYHLTT